MTIEEFQRLVDGAAPSDWLRLDWTQYDTEAFAAAFLPQVNMRFPDERLRLVDAADLFSSSIVRELGRASPAQGEQELFVMSVHTMPDGVPAVANKEKLVVADDELLARFIVSQNETVRVEFEFGRNVQKVLRQLKKGEAVAARLAMNSTVADLGKIARAGFDRRAVARLLRVVAKLPDMLEEEIKAEPVPPVPPFSAGSYGSMGLEGWAHGDIEEKALSAVGYTALERRQVYYGNWLRDFSQIIVGTTLHFSAKDTATLKELAGGNKYPDAPKHTPITDLLRLFTQTQWVEVMKILAVHEFAFKSEMNGGDPNKSYYDYMAAFNSEFGGLGADILGVYRPEEHLDNPKYLKNESIYGAAELDHPVRYQHEPPNALKTSSTLSTGLREDEERLPDGSGPLDVDEAEMMKNFLLHDIDADRPSPMSYFEEQLKLAVQKGRNKKGLRHLGAALHVLEDYYAHSNFVEIALIKIGEHKVWPWVDMTPEVKDLTNGAAKALLIPVTTGYFSSAATLASVVPKVAEVFFGPAPPYKPLQAGHRTFAEVLAQYFLYARSKNEEELEEDQRTKLLGWTYAELLAALLWVFKQRDDFRRARDEGGFWGPILRGAGEGAYWMGNALAFFPKLIITKFLEVVPPAILELQTKVGPPLQDDPSHTQLAKDPPNHHLNELAGELAVEAVRDVGERLKACWSGTTTAQSLVQHVRTRYFKHPSQTDWMDDHVKRWATRHTAEVGRAQVATPVDHIERKLDEYVQKTLPTEIKAIRKILGL